MDQKLQHTCANLELKPLRSAAIVAISLSLVWRADSRALLRVAAVSIARWKMNAALAARICLWWENWKECLD